jgi:hypothetical protein
MFEFLECFGMFVSAERGIWASAPSVIWKDINREE